MGVEEIRVRRTCTVDGCSALTPSHCRICPSSECPLPCSSPDGTMECVVFEHVCAGQLFGLCGKGSTLSHLSGQSLSECWHRQHSDQS